MDAGEVKGVEERVHPPVGLLGGKVYSVDPVGAQGGGKEKNVLFVVQGHLKAVKGLPGHPAVAEADIVQTPQLIQIGAQAPQVLQLLRCGAGLLRLLLKRLLPPLQREHLLLQLVEVGRKAVGIQGRIEGGVIQGHARLVGHLLRPAQQSGVGIAVVQRHQAFYPVHHLKGALRVKLLIDDAGAHHFVEPLQRPGHGEQLHRYDGHGVISFRDRPPAGVIAPPVGRDFRCKARRISPIRSHSPPPAVPVPSDPDKRWRCKSKGAR